MFVQSQISGFSEDTIQHRHPHTTCWNAVLSRSRSTLSSFHLVQLEQETVLIRSLFPTNERPRTRTHVNLRVASSSESQLVFVPHLPCLSHRLVTHFASLLDFDRRVIHQQILAREGPGDLQPWRIPSPKQARRSLHLHSGRGSARTAHQLPAA